MRPGLDHRVAERLEARGEQADVGGPVERRGVQPPTQEPHPVGHAQPLRQPLQLGFVLAGPGDPHPAARQIGQGGQADVVGLVAVQPAHAQQQRRVLRRVQCGARGGRVVPRHGEVRDVFDPVGRPALADQIVGDVAGVADQVVRAPIVFQVVVAAEPADPRPRTRARDDPAGAVHPLHQHLGVQPARQPADARAGGEVERRLEAQHEGRHPHGLQRRFAVGVGVDGGGLGRAVPLQRVEQVEEEGLRPAVARRAEQVQHRHGRLCSRAAGKAEGRATMRVEATVRLGYIRPPSW